MRDVVEGFQFLVRDRGGCGAMQGMVGIAWSILTFSAGKLRQQHDTTPPYTHTPPTQIHPYDATGARSAQRADAEKFMKMRKAQREADKARGKGRSRHPTEVRVGVRMCVCGEEGRVEKRSCVGVGVVVLCV